MASLKLQFRERGSQRINTSQIIFLYDQVKYVIGIKTGAFAKKNHRQINILVNQV